MSERFFWWRFI